MTPVEEWTTDQLLRCLDSAAMAYMVGIWGAPEAWSPLQLAQLRDGAAVRVRSGRVCECGRAKSQPGRKCISCANAERLSPHLAPRRCAHCGEIYAPKHRKHTRFCSPQCANAHNHPPLRDAKLRLRRRRAEGSRR